MDFNKLNSLFPNKILPYEYPKPYPIGDLDPKAIKAIVIGCDPSNFSNNGKTNQLETVFGISGKGQDGRYFAGILSNLQLVGLTLNDIYVQNLCRNYFDRVTNENDIWFDAASLWRKTLKDELNCLGIPKSAPVFLTSEVLYKALINEKHTKRNCKEFYENPKLIPIEPTENFLERPLIPLFRGGGNYYRLTKQVEYKNKVIRILADSKHM